MSNFNVAGRNPSLAGRGRVEHYRGRFVGGSAKPLFRTAKGRRRANLATVDAFKSGLVREQQRLGKGYSNIADLAVDRELAGVKLNAMGQPCGPDEEPQQAKNLSGDVFECLKQRFRNYSKTLDYACKDLKETYNEDGRYEHPLPDEVLTAIVANIDLKALAKRARLTSPDLTADMSWEEKKKREYLHQMNLRIRVREHARIIADGISKAYEAHMQNEPLTMRLNDGQVREVSQNRYLATRTLKNFPTAAVVQRLATFGNKKLAIDVEATGALVRQSFDECFLEQFGHYSTMLDRVGKDLRENYNKEGQYEHPLPDEALTAIVANIDVKALEERAGLDKLDPTGGMSKEEKTTRERDYRMKLRTLVQAHAQTIADGLSEAYKAHMRDEPLEMPHEDGQARQVPHSPYLAERTLEKFPFKDVVPCLAEFCNEELAIDVEATGDLIRQSFDQCFLEQQSQLKRENLAFIHGNIGIGPFDTESVGPALADELRNRKAYLALAGAKFNRPAEFLQEAASYTPTAPIERKLKTLIGIGDPDSGGNRGAPTIDDYQPGDSTLTKDWERLPLKEELYKNTVKKAVDDEVAKWKSSNEVLKKRNPYLYQYIEMRAKAWFGTDYDPDQDPSLRTAAFAAGAARLEISTLENGEQLEKMFLEMDACRQAYGEIKRNLNPRPVKIDTREQLRKKRKELNKRSQECANADRRFKCMDIYKKIEDDGANTTIKETLTRVLQDLSKAREELQTQIDSRHNWASQSYIESNLKALEARSNKLDRRNFGEMSAEEAQQTVAELSEWELLLTPLVNTLKKGKQPDTWTKEYRAMAEGLAKKFGKQTKLLKAQANGRQMADAKQAEASKKAQREKLEKAEAEEKRRAEEEKRAAEQAEAARLAAEQEKRQQQAEQERLAAKRAEEERLAAEQAEKERLAALSPQEQAPKKYSKDQMNGIYGKIAFDATVCDSHYVSKKFGSIDVREWSTPRRFRDAARSVNAACKFVDGLEKGKLENSDEDEFLREYEKMLSKLAEIYRAERTLDHLNAESIEAAKLVYSHLEAPEGAVQLAEELKDERYSLKESGLGYNAVPIEWKMRIASAVKQHHGSLPGGRFMAGHQSEDCKTALENYNDDRAGRIDFGDFNDFVWTYTIALSAAKLNLMAELELYAREYDYLDGKRLFPSLYGLTEIWEPKPEQKNKEQENMGNQDLSSEKRMVSLKSRSEDPRESGPATAIEHLRSRVNDIDKSQHNKIKKKTGLISRKPIDFDVKKAMSDALWALGNAAEVRQRIVTGERVSRKDRKDAYDAVVNQLSKYRGMPKPKKKEKGGIYGELYYAVRRDLELAKAELKKHQPDEM